MPLIAFAVLAYAAGLAAGFLGAPSPRFCSALACAAIAAVKRDAVYAALGALFVAGACIAMYDAAHDARCRAEAPRRAQWSAHSRMRPRPARTCARRCAGPGARCPHRCPSSADARRPAIACRSRAPFSSLRAGSRSRTRASRPMARAIVLLVARAAIGARIDTLFRRDAPLVRALLIADERAVDPAVRDRFAVAGIVHMLSISGLHVAIIAMAVELLCRMARLRPATASIATLVITAAYVAVIGLPAPAVRSGVMLGVRSLCKLLQRPTSPWAALALGAAAPLVSPATVLDLGYQLSVLGMAALVASGALAKRVIPGAWTGLRASLARTLLTSCVACCASAPLVAWTFGRISLVAPITNILATPVVAMLQPALFLTVAISPVRALGMLLADACHPLLRALDGIATVGASVPYAALTVAPTLATAILAGAASIALLAACVSRAPGRALRRRRRCARDRGVAAALARAFRRDGAPHDRRGPGRRDRASHARGALASLRCRPRLDRRRRGALHRDPVPATTGRRRDALRSLASARRSRGRRRERDRRAPSRRVLGRCVRGYESAVPCLAHRGARCTGVVAARASGRLARHRRRALARARARLRMDGRAQGSERRQRGGARRVRCDTDAADGRCGEAGRRSGSWRRYGDGLRADVLKVGHHGSNTSSTPGFLALVRPRVALISVGAGNMYGHPSASVLRALTSAGAAVVRTDLEGSIVCRTDGQRLEIEEGGDRWTVAARAAP